MNQLTSDCELCVVGGGWGGVLVAGHTSVSPSVCIANTLSGECQCTGHLGREGGREGGGGGGRERDELRDKLNGCLNERKWEK